MLLLSVKAQAVKLDLLLNRPRHFMIGFVHADAAGQNKQGRQPS